jgi:hypothetical protein
VSPVRGQQFVQPCGRLGDDLPSFTSKPLIPGAGYLCQRLVQFMHGVATVPSPGVAGVAGVTVPGEAAGPAGARWHAAVTEGLPATLAAPGALAFSGIPAKAVQAVRMAWVPPAADARASAPSVGLVRDLVHDLAPVLKYVAIC